MRKKIQHKNSRSKTGQNGKYTKNTREATRKNISAQKEGRRDHWANMGTADGEMGNRKEKEHMEYVHKKRNTLQKEIGKGKKDLAEQQKKRKQREILTAWKEAADYLRANQTNIKYSRIPIIDLNKRTNTHRTSRGKNKRKRRSTNMLTGTMTKHLEKPYKYNWGSIQNCPNKKLHQHGTKEKSISTKQARAKWKSGINTRKMENATDGKCATKITGSSRQQ